MLDDLSPDFHSAKQYLPVANRESMFLPGADHVTERVDAVCSHIPGSWLVGLPEVVSHVNAAKPVIGLPQPPQTDSPCPICDYLSDPNARMPYCLGPPVLVMKRGEAVNDKPPHKALLRSLGLWGGDRRGRLG